MRYEDFKIWMERIQDRFDQLDKKIDSLAKTRNCLDGMQLLDNQDVMELTKMSARTLQRHRETGKLKSINDGGKNYYRPEDVLKFIREEL